MTQKNDIAPDVISARAALAASLKYLHENEAAAAARALVRAKRADQLRRSRELSDLAGIKAETR